MTHGSCCCCWMRCKRVQQTGSSSTSSGSSSSLRRKWAAYCRAFSTCGLALCLIGCWVETGESDFTAPGCLCSCNMRSKSIT
jgi:hypothetical protein